jgi:hypothetical protein
MRSGFEYVGEINHQTESSSITRGRSNREHHRAEVMQLGEIFDRKVAIRSRILPRVIPRISAALDWLPRVSCKTRVIK